MKEYKFLYEKQERLQHQLQDNLDKKTIAGKHRFN